MISGAAWYTFSLSWMDSNPNTIIKQGGTTKANSNERKAQYFTTHESRTLSCHKGNETRLPTTRHTFLDEALLVDLYGRSVLLNGRVHLGLREGGLIDLVVSMAAVTNLHGALAFIFSVFLKTFVLVKLCKPPNALMK